ncbi:MAG: hypothetical protein HYU99_00575 [Deltaproteobacteria bacterium]|nr:hypothetical protein [Deltaproteobacteria bacterium]
MVGIDHEFDFGANLVIHLTKRDKAPDPYFMVGLKWMGDLRTPMKKAPWEGLFRFRY